MATIKLQTLSSALVSTHVPLNGKTLTTRSFAIQVSTHTLHGLLIRFSRPLATTADKNRSRQKSQLISLYVAASSFPQENCCIDPVLPAYHRTLPATVPLLAAWGPFLGFRSLSRLTCVGVR